MSKSSVQQRPLLRTPIEIACLPDEAIITAEEAAMLYGCSVARLHRWEREGRGPVCLRPASRTDAKKYRIGDIRRWMALPVVEGGT